MAGAVNIPIGVTVSDLIAGFKVGAQSVSQFTTQFRAQFDGLKGSTDAPAGALSALTRQFNIAKREINDVLAVGGTPTAELTNKYALLKNSIDSVRGAFNAPIQATPFQALNQRLTETRARIQDILAKGGRVPPELTARFSQLTQQVNQVNRAVGQTSSSLNGFNLGALTGGLLSVSAAFSLIKQGLQITSDFQRIDSALRAVSDSSADYARTQNFLRGTSDSLGISYEALATSYKGLKAASDGTALEGVQTERIFSAVARAGASLKLSNDEVRGSLLAIQQMMSKGTVQAEELRGQLGERLPGAFNIMARALGVTTAELGKMLQAGQVIASDVLPKFATELEKTFGAGAQSNVNTMAGGFTRATDQLKLFVAEFSQEKGIDTFFSKMGNRIADTITAMREAQRQGVSLFDLGKRPVLIEQAKLRQQFASANAIDRAAILDNLRLQADDFKNKIANPGAFGYNAAVVNANKRALTDVETSILILKREQLKLTVTERQEAEKAARVKLDVALKTFDIDKAKDRQGVLAKQIQNLTGDGKAVPTALRSEYDKLTAQIERATESTKKHTAAHIAAMPTLTTNERLLKQLSLRLKEAGETAPDGLRTQVAVLQQLVAEEKRAIAGAVDLGEKLKTLSARGASNERVGNLVSGGGVTTAGLFGQTATVGLPGLTEFQQRTSGQFQDAALKLTEDKQKLRFALSDIPNVFGSVKQEMGRLADSDPLNSRGVISAVLGSAQGIAEAMASAKAGLLSGGIDLLSSFGEGLATGKASLKSVIVSIIGLIADSISTIGRALIVTAIPLIAAGGILAPLGLKQILTGGAIVLAAGVAKGLASNIPGFAQGGTFYGEQVIRVGEYAGARSNPELVGKASEFAKYLKPSGGSSQVFIPDIMLQGSMIRIALNRADDSAHYLT